MATQTTTLRTAKLTTAFLLLWAGAPTLFAGDDESALERATTLLEQVEAAEMGLEVDLSPERLLERAARSEHEITTHLQTHPDDVEALVVFARLGWLRRVLEPVVMTPGEVPAVPGATYAPLHEKLDRALALQPGNAEAHHWKARLYGLRQPVSLQGRMAYAPHDLARAIEHAEKAVALEPTNVVYREALALYLVDDQRPDEAIEVIRKAGEEHPIYLLLSDLDAVPIPRNATFSSLDSESYAEKYLSQGEFEYPRLRVRYYLVPTPLTELEDFFAAHWDGFEFIRHGEREVGRGKMRFAGQHLTWEKGRLRPTDPDTVIDDEDLTGIFLSVVDLHRVPKEMRRETPAGVKVPAGFGKTFSHLILINYRAFD